MTDLKKLRRGGFYFIGKKPFVSVTKVIDVIDKPALRYWYAERVYLATIKDPTINKELAMRAPYEARDKAADRGSTIHSVIEAYKKGTPPDLKSIPDQFQGYVKAFYTAVDQLNISIVAQEKTVFSKKHKYAGTLDILAHIDNKETLNIIDVKTGKEIYPTAFIQGAAYANAVEEENKKIEGIGVLLLMEDGSYKWQYSSDWANKFKAFLACKFLWQEVNSEMLKNIGYFEE